MHLRVNMVISALFVCLFVNNNVALFENCVTYMSGCQLRRGNDGTLAQVPRPHTRLALVALLC